MIDVEADIYSMAAEAVLERFPDAYVSGEHVSAPPMFPALFLEQSLSAELESARDSSREENANALTWTASVYSNSRSGAKAECKAILEIVDAQMRRANMTRLSAQPIDNAADPSIYRMVGRWSGVADKHGNMHWR